MSRGRHRDLPLLGLALAGSPRNLRFRGVPLAAALALLLPTLGLLWATAPGPAQEALRGAVASLAQAEALVAAQHPELQGRAARGEVAFGGLLEVPAFPVPVSVAAARVMALSPAELTEALVEEAAGQLYRQGPSLFALGGEAPRPQEVPRASRAGLLRLGLGLFTQGAHGALRLAALALGAVALLLGLALVASPRDRRLRWLPLAAPLLAASLAWLAVGVGLRLGLAALPAAPPEGALLPLGQGFVDRLIRIALAFALAGGALVMAGGLARRRWGA